MGLCEKLALFIKVLRDCAWHLGESSAILEALKLIDMGATLRIDFRNTLLVGSCLPTYTSFSAKEKTFPTRSVQSRGRKGCGEILLDLG